MLLEQMSSVIEEVLNMRKELQLFKIEMSQRVGQVENGVKLQQFQYQTMSLEVTSLRKELAEVTDIRNGLKKKVEAKDRIDDLKQNSRRNCLIFTGIKTVGEDETDNTYEVILDICRNKLQIELHRFTLDRTHRLGGERIPRPDLEVPNLGPLLQSSLNIKTETPFINTNESSSNQG